MKDHTQIRQDILAQPGGVNFDFTNQAGGKDHSSVIYITDDPAYNKLVLTIRNNSGSSLELPSVDPAKAELSDIPLLLQLVGPLSHDEIEKIDISDSNLRLAIRDVPGQPQPVLALAPAKAMILKDADSLSVHFTQVTASKKDPKHGSVTVQILGLYNWQNGVSLQYPPSGKHNLLDSVRLAFADGGGHHDNRDVVYVCGDQKSCTANLDDNQLIFSIMNTKSSPLAQGASNAVFKIWFPASSSATGALGTLSDLNNIATDLGQHGQDFGWEINKNSQSHYPVWTLMPKNPTILGNGSDAIVHFNLETIMSHLPAAETLMYIAWNDIPGYDDGVYALSVSKEDAQPTVKVWTSAQHSYDYGEKVGFTYRTYGAEQWEIEITETGGSYHDSYDVPCSQKGAASYLLKALPGHFVAALRPIGQTVEVQATVEFTIDAAAHLSTNKTSVPAGQDFALSWNITRGLNWRLESKEWRYALIAYHQSGPFAFIEVISQYDGNTDKPPGTTFDTGSRDSFAIPSLTPLKNSGFVVAWVGSEQAGSPLHGFCQIYDAASRPVGSRISLSNARAVGVASLEDSHFVLGWTDENTPEVFYRIYDDNGQAVGEKKTFVADKGVMSIAIISLSNGGFMMVCMSKSSCYYQRYDAAGNPVADKGSLRSGGTFCHAVELTGGGIVIAWQEPEPNGNGHFQCYDAAGNPVGTRGDLGPIYSVAAPSLAAVPDNQFRLAWVDTKGRGYYQSYLDDGKAVGNKNALEGAVESVETASFSNGDFVLSWIKRTGDTNGYRCHQCYNAEGEPLGRKFEFGSYFANPYQLTGDAVTVNSFAKIVPHVKNAPPDTGDVTLPALALNSHELTFRAICEGPGGAYTPEGAEVMIEVT